MIGYKMKIMAVLLGCLFAIKGFGTDEYPENSLYQLESNWQTHNAETLSIAELSGHLQIMAFVYTYCEHTCPLILAKLKSIEASLPEGLVDQTRFTLISLDPERDTPEILKEYMLEHKLDESRWTMLHAAPDKVREIAAVLGTRYRPMGQDDIAHSNTLTILGADGVVVHQAKGLGESNKMLIDAIFKHKLTITAQ